MYVGDELAGDPTSQVAHRLMADYQGRIAPSTVQAVVTECWTQLQGQVRPHSMEELLHRLSDCRLAELDCGQ